MNTKQHAIASLTLLTSTMAYGLGIRIPDQDPLATARGNAFTATADNPSAIYYNPAGITQLDGQNVRAGFYDIYLKDKASLSSGSSVNTMDQTGLAPQLYYTAGFKDIPITVGLGVYSPYGLALKWPDNGPFNSVTERGQISYLDFNPVVAWKICPSLSVAGGASFDYARADIRQRGALGSGQFRFVGDGTTPGFNAGVLWSPCEYASVGATYRSETIFNFRGYSSDNSIPGGGYKSGASADFAFPQNATIGFSWRPTPQWNVEFDVDWTDWKQLGTVMLLENPPIGNQPFKFNWSSSLMYELGVTRKFDNGWRASGGYMFSRNSVPDEGLYPVVPDSDRHIFSVGVGQTRNAWSWDLAYQFAWGPPRTISNAGIANGSYEFFSNAITFALGYHF